MQIRYREHFGGCQMGGGWVVGKKGEEIKKYKLVVEKQSWGL